MKKLLNKFRKSKEQIAPTRITSDTVAEHRERVLAGGRRFKYPIQYARHKLVINAILISFAAFVIAIAIGYWQLYGVQNTSEFFYRVTRFVPVPVAVVDGQNVLYGDYLMKYRSSVHYLENKEQVSLKTDDGKRQVEYIKQQSMQDAIADAYAEKLAGQLGIKIENSEIEDFLLQQRRSEDGEISLQTYESVIADFYGWSPSEYRHAVERKLLRQKVSYSMDDQAKALADEILLVATKPASVFKSIADSYAKQGKDTVSYGVSGWVPNTNQDGGLAKQASQGKKDQISLIKSTMGDGYYVVKTIDIKATEVSYEYIHIELTAFDTKLEEVKNAGKIQEYITITKN